MGERNVQLHCRQRTGKGRIGIAVDKDAVRLVFEQYFFERLEHPRGLLAVAGGADAEVDVGIRNVQLFEEHVGHVLVVVLPGVNQELFDALLRAQDTGYGGCLDELRAGTDNRYDLQGSSLSQTSTEKRRIQAPKLMARQIV